MSTLISKKILERIGQPDLLEQLKSLPGTDLNSLLLEVFRQRTAEYSPSRLLQHYQRSRLVKPADLPVLALKQMEVDVLKMFDEHFFEPIELSPVAVLGSCSTVAPADQNKVLSALRGTEVLADATNAMALHVSDLKKTKAWMPRTPDEKIRFSTIQRHVRTQSVTVNGFTPHFKIGCLVTSGLDTGNFLFEKQSLLEHMRVMKRLFENYYRVEVTRFRLVCRNGYPDAFLLANEIKAYVQQVDSGIKLEVVRHPDKENEYYKGIQYKVDINVNGRSFEIADGGFVDWTQQLLQNKKERFLITGFGFDFMYRILHGLL
jgi:hypothetical protein